MYEDDPMEFSFHMLTEEEVAVFRRVDIYYDTGRDPYTCYLWIRSK